MIPVRSRELHGDREECEMKKPYELAMVGRYGHAIHVIDPANGRPLCENRSKVWSARRHPDLRPLHRTGIPTCAHCRRYLEATHP
jgi:hypothetical protein